MIIRNFKNKQKKAIYEGKNKEKKFSADDLFPIIIYIILNSNAEHFYANIEFFFINIFFLLFFLNILKNNKKVSYKNF